MGSRTKTVPCSFNDFNVGKSFDIVKNGNISVRLRALLNHHFPFFQASQTVDGEFLGNTIIFLLIAKERRRHGNPYFKRGAGAYFLNMMTTSAIHAMKTAEEKALTQVRSNGPAIA